MVGLFPHRSPGHPHMVLFSQTVWSSLTFSLGQLLALHQIRWLHSPGNLMISIENKHLHRYFFHVQCHAVPHVLTVISQCHGALGSGLVALHVHIRCRGTIQAVNHKLLTDALGSASVVGPISASRGLSWVNLFSFVVVRFI